MLIALYACRVFREIYLLLNKFSKWSHVPVVKSVCLVNVRVLMETLKYTDARSCIACSNIDEEDNAMESFDEDNISDTGGEI